MYDMGKGELVMNDVKAAYWHEKGEGVSRSDIQVAKWCHMAAEQGNAEAISDPGRLYYMGRGVKKDEKKTPLAMGGRPLDGAPCLWFLASC